MSRMRLLARLVIPALVATTLQTPVAGQPADTTPPAKSIHEWKSKPIATPAADVVAAPVADAAVTPAVRATVPKSPITISLTSTLHEGTLVVALDDVPIFNEKFRRPALLISQTTTWDPLQVAA